MGAFGSSNSTLLGVVCTPRTASATVMTCVKFCSDIPVHVAGHCKRLAPAWGELGDAFKSNPKVNVAHVDCTQQKDVCSKYEVRSHSVNMDAV